jgi:NAD(P) transhydrogenase subunit alpha
LMLKDNVIVIDWTDEIIARTALTHAGKMAQLPAIAA